MNSPLRTIIVLFILSLCCWSGVVIPASLAAQEPAGETAVETGKEALQKSGAYPWYDPQADAPRDLEAKESKNDDSETRRKGWERKPANWNWNWGTGPNISWGSGITLFFQILGTLLLIVLLIVIAVLLYRFFLVDPEIELDSSAAIVTSSEQEDAVRLENLPIPVANVQTDLLDEARRLASLARYGEAIVFLYAYMLVQLDKHRCVRLAKGKTNRQYLRELRERPALHTILDPTIVAFEDSFFGHHTLSQSRFEATMNRVGEFQSLLVAAGAAS